MIRWVCFDVGETIFDETGFWGRWADWLGVPRADFTAKLREIIAAGRHHREVFEHYRPGFDLAAAQAQRLAQGDEPSFIPADTFPDVRPCFAALKAHGLNIGVAGNNTPLTEAAVLRLGLPVDFIASSDRWGVSKPDPAFFQRLAEACQVPPEHIAYVGDRLDNDVLPADRFGMTGVFLRRGLWAEAHRAHPDAAKAMPYGAPPAGLAIDTLAELAPALATRRFVRKQNAPSFPRRHRRSPMAGIGGNPRAMQPSACLEWDDGAREATARVAQQHRATPPVSTR